MDIIYRKDTLYVYLKQSEEVDFKDLKRRIKRIMDIYKIDNLVIDTKDGEIEYIHELERRFCFKNKAKVLVK